MARKRSTGLNTVTRKAADGTITRHYYDRATKKYLGSDRDKALAAVAPPPAAPPEVLPPAIFSGLCDAYLKSSRFKKLKPRSQDINEFYVNRLKGIFGDVPTKGITRPVVIKLREQHAERGWYCNHLLGTLRLVLGYGVDIGEVVGNAAVKHGGGQPPPRDAVWTREQTEKLLANAPKSLHLACALLLYTAQRPADVLAMTWPQLSTRDGRYWLMLRQQKTNEPVMVPVHRDLAAILSTAPRRGILMVPSPRGRPWAYRNFCRAWDGLMTKVKLADKGLQRRDMRRTAMVRMAEGGASLAAIAAVSGHTIDQTTRILDTYIPRRGEVALGAIEAWENRPKGNVLHIPPRKRS